MRFASESRIRRRSSIRRLAILALIAAVGFAACRSEEKATNACDQGWLAAKAWECLSAGPVLQAAEGRQR